jgi:hypothetical protein
MYRSPAIEFGLPRSWAGRRAEHAAGAARGSRFARASSKRRAPLKIRSEPENQSNLKKNALWKHLLFPSVSEKEGILFQTLRGVLGPLAWACSPVGIDAS